MCSGALTNIRQHTTCIRSWGRVERYIFAFENFGIMLMGRAWEDRRQKSIYDVNEHEQNANIQNANIDEPMTSAITSASADVLRYSPLLWFLMLLVSTVKLVDSLTYSSSQWMVSAASVAETISALSYLPSSYNWFLDTISRSWQICRGRGRMEPKSDCMACSTVVKLRLKQRLGVEY